MIYGCKILVAVTAALLLLAGNAVAEPVRSSPPSSTHAQTRAAQPQIALTFDDLPAHGPLPIGGDRLVIAKAIIAALAATPCPGIWLHERGFWRGRSEFIARSRGLAKRRAPDRQSYVRPRQSRHRRADRLPRRHATQRTRDRSCRWQPRLALVPVSLPGRRTGPDHPRGPYAPICSGRVTGLRPSR